MNGIANRTLNGNGGRRAYTRENFSLRPRVNLKQYSEYKTSFSGGYNRVFNELTDAVQHDAKSKVSFQCCVGRMFEPVAEKTNIVYTMCESRELPADVIPKLRQADAIITASSFCAEVFRQQFDCPVYVVPLGIDSKMFPIAEREMSEPFRWLFVGSSDPRKGSAVIWKAWQELFYAQPGIELYVKMIGSVGRKFDRKDNVISDLRRVSDKQMNDLYAKAHGFLFPSLGEGFGLTLIEAMATGLPCVGTSTTGHKDFFNHDTGWVIGHEPWRSKIYGSNRPSNRMDGMYTVSNPNVGDLSRNMIRVMRQYEKALIKARAAAETIHDNYSWDRFRDGIKAVLARYVSV